MQGNFSALALIFGKNPQLRIRRGALHNDRAALFEMLAAGQCFGFCRGQLQNAVKQFATVIAPDRVTKVPCTP